MALREVDEVGWCLTGLDAAQLRNHYEVEDALADD
jgi:hypothetical protein